MFLTHPNIPRVNSLAGFVSSLADFCVIFQVSVMANSDKILAEIVPNPRFVDFEHIPNHTKHFKWLFWAKNNKLEWKQLKNNEIWKLQENWCKMWVLLAFHNQLVKSKACFNGMYTITSVNCKSIKTMAFNDFKLENSWNQKSAKLLILGRKKRQSCQLWPQVSPSIFACAIQISVVSYCTHLEL